MSLYDIKGGGGQWAKIMVLHKSINRSVESKNKKRYRNAEYVGVKGRLPSEVAFRQRSSSVKGRLPSKVVFISIEGRFPSKVVFHLRLSSIKGCLP